MEGPVKVWFRNEGTLFKGSVHEGILFTGSVHNLLTVIVHHTVQKNTQMGSKTFLLNGKSAQDVFRVELSRGGPNFQDYRD